MTRMTELPLNTQFGRLTTIEAPFSQHVGKQLYAHVKCRCECGEEVVKMVKHLKTGRTKSCGCLRREVASQRSKDAANRRKETQDGKSTGTVPG